MTTIEKHFDGGQRAALRGCYRVLGCADSQAEYDAWYRGWDSVPRELRGKWPLTGPVPDHLARLLDEVNNAKIAR